MVFHAPQIEILPCTDLLEARYQKYARKYSSATKFLQAAAGVIDRASGDMPDVSSAMYNAHSAVSFDDNNNTLGLWYAEKFKEAQDRTYAQTSVETTKYAVAYSELGMAHVLNGHSTDDVMQLLEKSGQIRQRLPGFEKVNLFNVIRGKAYVHVLRGELGEAFNYLSVALQEREDEYGRDDERGGR